MHILIFNLMLLLAWGLITGGALLLSVGWGLITGGVTLAALVAWAVAVGGLHAGREKGEGA